MVTLPSPNPVPNTGTVFYDYDVGPTETISTGSNSNNVFTQINTADVESTKTVSNRYAKVGDTLIYSITLKNTGNVTANNIIFKDTIPNGTSYVSNSFAIDGVTQPSFDPTPPGVNIGNIASSGIKTVTFRVVVITMPSPNPITNNSTNTYNYTVDPSVPNGASGSNNSTQAATQVNQATIDNTNGNGLIKTVDKAYAKVSDILTYTITLKNTGNVAANNVVFTDTIPNGTSFNTGSVLVNSVSTVGSPAPPTGLSIGSIAAGSQSVIVYTVTVITVPSPNPIPNNGTVNYNFTIDPSVPNGGSGSGNTNTVNTQINQATTSQIVKTVDKAYAKVSNVLTYTITIKNSGNVTANNVVLTDTIPNGTSFNTGSVRLNGVPASGSPAPPTGFSVGSIGPGQASTVVFTVTVTTIPSPNPIPNNSTVNYNYTIDPSVPNGGSGSGNSNQVTTQVNQANIDNTNGGGLVKTVDKAYAKVGEILTYKITIKNTGNVTANNVVFTDTIPSGTSFDTGSLKLNGSIQGGSPAPPSGVSVGTIAPGAASTVEFTVTVLTIPTPNPIPNSGTVNYNFTVDPSVPNGEAGSGNTNIVNTQINQANIDNSNGGGLVKAVDKTFAKVNDVLTYTITLTNTGNVTANNVVLTDTIPSGTSFNAGSVTVNGVSNPGNPAPPTGVNVGSIGPKATTTVIFTVTVNTIPTPNPVPNNATVNFTYTIDPSIPNGQSSSGNSNQVTTQINQANIDNSNGGGLIKQVDKAYAKIGDVLTYTISLSNTGNVAANNVVFTDTIPNGTTFDTGSVTVNNVPVSGTPAPPTGINVGTIQPGFTSTVRFTVTVITIPTPNPIPNNSTVNYNFTIDPAVPNGGQGSGNSNQVTTQVNAANFSNDSNGIVKLVDKTAAKVGDILTYTIGLRNQGNVTANNVVFTDTIPGGTSFNIGSVQIDGASNPGDPTPPTGINLASIAPGGVTTVLFTVTVTTIPTVNPIPNQGKIAYTYTTDPSVPDGSSGENLSNTVFTAINQATIDNTVGGGMVKTVDKAYAKVNDILTYTVTLKNTGNIAANNVRFTDTIPNGTSFNTGSVRVNGVPVSGTPAPPVGINVGTIGAGAAATILFTVTVNTIPVPNPVPNNSTVNYTYTVDPSIPNGQSGSGNSNQVTTQVNQATMDNTNGGGLRKTVSKAFAMVGDILTYTISATNTGNVTANNVVFTDTIPNGTSFNAGSVIINGVGSSGNPSPPSGVSIGSIAPGATSTIRFTVTVITIPSPNPIPNSGTMRYNFTIDPSLPNGASASGNTNIVTTQVNDAVIDNKSGGGLVKTVIPNYAKVGETVIYSITMKNTGNVPANNVVLTDTIPNNTTFVPGTVTIDGANAPGNPNPQTGVSVGSIAAGAATTVRFNVTIDTFPSPNPIPNTATALFNFTVDPSFPNSMTASGNSNIVTTQVNQAIINDASGGVVKSVDKAYAKVNDILNYTITIGNSGNTTANNVIVVDTIPNGTSFVSGSFSINGILQPSLSPNPPGANIGSIVPGGTTTVKFQVTVTTIPTPNPIPNSTNITYSYTMDPSIPDGASGSANSNTVTTQVNDPRIDFGSGGLVKSVDKAYAQVSDILTYTITLKNTGTVTAENVVFKDTIPTGTSFNSGSVLINGTPDSGSPAPPTGLSLGSIGIGATTTVIFKVTVTTVPATNPIPNSGTATYSFTLDPQFPNGATGAGNTNIVNTQIVSPNLQIAKSVNKAYADVGDTLNYTIVYKNLGNVTFSSVVLVDTIPSSTSFITNSLYLNGNQQLGANPVSGFNIGNLGVNSVNTVIFSVSVFTLPTINPITNTAVTSYNYFVDPSLPVRSDSQVTTASSSTQVYNASFNPFLGGFFKNVDKTNVTIGSTITYTLTLKNTGNVTAYNVIFKDTVPTGTAFVANSLAVNGVTTPDNVQTGTTLGTIGPAVFTTVTFKVTVTTIVSNYLIDNQGIVNYEYTVDPSVGLKQGSNLSNIVTSEQKVVKVTLTKSSNQTSVFVGGTILYQVVAKNTGNTTANTVFINDTLPAGLSYVAGSVTVDGTSQPSYNMITGFTLPNLGPSVSTTITFRALAVSVPSGNLAKNVANMTYNYVIDPSLPSESGGANSNADVVIVSYFIDPVKPIPCNVIESTVPVGFMNKLATKAATSTCTQVCGDCGSYRVDGLCTIEDYACVNTQIAQYKMWQEQSINNSFVPNAPWTEIESISATINIIRSDKIITPDTGTCPNGEGKLLSGYKQIIEGVIRYTVTTINTMGEVCTDNYYDLFSSFIIVNRSYSGCDFEVRGCIEDLSITKATQSKLDLSATIFLFLVPSDAGCKDTCLCQFDSQIQDCVSNSSLCPKASSFLSTCERTWNEFNVFFTEDTGLNNIGSLSSINANITNVKYKAITTPKPSNASNESLYLSGDMLLVSFVVNIKINYVTNDGTNVVKRVNLRVPASTYIIVDSQDLCASIYTISTCLEDVYACNLDGSRIFTNTTILVKAGVCNPTLCC